MDLAALITQRAAELGALEHPQRKPLTLRDLERRATERGHKISFSSLGAYARGERTSMPKPAAREALAAALGVSVEDVERAAVQSTAPQVVGGNGQVDERTRAWLVLTEGRTDSEVDHLLDVAREVLRGLDAIRGRDDHG